MAKKERSTEVQFVPTPPPQPEVVVPGMGGEAAPSQLNQYNVGSGKDAVVPPVVEAPGANPPAQPATQQLANGTVRSDGQDVTYANHVPKHAGLVFNQVRRETVIKDEDGKRKGGTVRTDH